MAKYVVTVFRSEAVAFEIEAADADDAQERYGSDGEEVSNETTNIEVTGVHLASDYYAATEITA